LSNHDRMSKSQSMQKDTVFRESGDDMRSEPELFLLSRFVRSLQPFVKLAVLSPREFGKTFAPQKLE